MRRVGAGSNGSGRSRRASTAALTALGLVLAACGGDDSIAPESASDAEIHTTSRTLVDASRATRANGTFGGAPERTIETRIWLRGKAPRGAAACGSDGCRLVLLAHGFGGSTARFDAIARRIAEAGYVVAAPAFPLTNEAAPGGHQSALTDVLEQPADLSFVIDRLFEASAREDDELHGRISPDQVGVLGHSLGGATVLAASRLGCCTDERIGAVIGVAAVAFVVPLFGEDLPASGPPTLFLTGLQDPVVTPSVARDAYDAILPPRILVILDGSGHVELIENVGPPFPILEATAEATLAFLDAYPGGDSRDLTRVLDDLGAAGHQVERDL